jgi:nucleotide-binding universal stress UspA family protein
MADKPAPIKRILVALDASGASVAAIRTAVDLAARFRAELIGLFVEDVNLLRSAELPFVREVGAFSLDARRLNLIDLERQLRAQAERLRRTLETSARLQGIPWEFRVTRGPVALEIITAGAEADLMILGKAGRSLGLRRRMGSTVRAVVLQHPGMTFIMTTGLPAAEPVIAVYDASAAAARALAVAAALVAEQDRRLTLILAGDSREEVRALREQALDRLSPAHIAVDVHVIRRPTPAGLAWLVRMSGSGPVVLPCGEGGLEEMSLCALIEEIPNPVLLVR